MARGDKVPRVTTRTTDDSLQALLSARFRAQAQMIAALTDHPVLIGTGRESAFGALLQELLPRRFEVLTGVVAQLDEKGRPRRTGAQADVIVADTLDFPVLLRVGTTAVVVPDSVRAVVEVKSTLTRPPGTTGSAATGDAEEAGEAISAGDAQTFLDALLQIGKLRLAIPDGGRGVFTVLFSYNAPVYPKRLREWLALSLAARGTFEPGTPEASALTRFALPDLILSVSGAMASKNIARSVYEFYRCPAGGSKDGSAVIAAVADLLAAVAPSIPGDRSRIDNAFAFVHNYLATSRAPEPDCPDLPL